MSRFEIPDSDEDGNTSIETDEEQSEDTTETETIQRIDLNDLNIDPENVRGVDWNPSSEEDEELLESIEANGVHSPLLVRPAPEDVGGNVEYGIMAGGRRFNAAVEVGLSEVPCIVDDVDDVTAAGISVSENRDRKDVPAYEEVFTVIDHFQRMDGEKGKTEKVVELADTFGTSESTIHRYLNIGVLPELARDLIRNPSDQDQGTKDYLHTQTEVNVLNRVPDSALSTQKAAQLSRNLYEVQRGGGGRVPTIDEDTIGKFAAQSIDKRTEDVANASELLGENPEVSMDQAWEAARKARIHDIEVREARKALTDDETDSEESEGKESPEPTEPTQDSTEGAESDTGESDESHDEEPEPEGGDDDVEPEPSDDWNSPPVSISCDSERYDLTGVDEDKRDRAKNMIEDGDLRVGWVSRDEDVPHEWIEVDPPMSKNVVYHDKEPPRVQES